MLQRQQAIAAANQAVTEWTALVQQLADSPVASPADGQTVIKNAIEHAQNLEQQQRHAFHDLASKDEALCDAKHKLGKLCLVLVSCIRCVWSSPKVM
jgi:predicted GNAT superfamily acetyltransferase